MDLSERNASGEIARHPWEGARAAFFSTVVDAWIVEGNPVNWLDVGAGADADLASYLLFDGGFAQTLIEMGRRDAHARRDEIEAFLFEDPDAILSPSRTVETGERSGSKPPE